MNQSKINKFASYKTVSKVEQNNISKWENQVAFAATVTKFNAKLDELADAAKAQTPDFQGISKDKQKHFDELETSMLSIAGKIRAYSNVTKDYALQKQVDYTHSDLTHTPDGHVVDLAKRVLEAARKHLANLGDYGVDADVISDYSQKIDMYASNVESPRIAIVNRKVATSNIDKLIHEIDDILHNEIDALMEQFRFSEPEFYQAYHNARIIVDAGHRFEETTEPTQPVM